MMKYPEVHKHPALYKHADIINTLQKERVVDIHYDSEENAFYITEMCDEWFGYKLTKEDCLELSELFRDIADAL